jgi:hypothetical protein
MSSLAVAVFAVALSATVTPALACSCAVAPSASATTDPNDRVFLGRVESILPQGNGFLQVRFRTEIGESMSGGQVAVVLTPSSEAACGYPFLIRSTYEVHARITGDSLVTDACSGTRISSRALPVVGYPTDPVPNRMFPLLVWGAIAIAILGGLTIVGTGIRQARRQGGR